MAGLPCHRKAECKMIDGTVIRGWLYETKERAPAIIMSQGFNCVKEMTLPEVAESFYFHGWNVFLYDARSVGESDGTPRNLLDPLQMAEDLSDIYSYVASLPSVNPRKVVLWGMSFGAVVTSTCAAIDRRPSAVVMVAPLFSYVHPDKADKAYALIIKDRVSQLRGNEPYSITPFTSTGDNPIGMGGGVEAYNLMVRTVQSNVPNFRDKVSLQTYYKLAMFRPKEYLSMIKSPLLMVIPELDTISSPVEQQEAFDMLETTKTLHLAKGKEHLSIVDGDETEELKTVMIKYLDGVLGS